MRPYTGHGYACAECGGSKDKLATWFKCGEDVFCSAGCAVLFLLRREEDRL